jgi:hypothetical protein
MRTLLICALATTLAVGCSCTVLPQANGDSCTDANGVACFDRMGESQPVEPEPASSKTDSGTAETNSTIAAKPEKPSSAHARDRAHPAIKTAKSTTMAAKVEPPASRIPPSPRSLKTRPQRDSKAPADADATRAKVANVDPTGSAAANSNTRTIKEQVAAATAAAERTTVATLVPPPEPNANAANRSNQSEAVLRVDAEQSPPASPNNTDLLIVLLLARPEIKVVSDLTRKNIAIDDRYSASNGHVRTAIAAAGAAEVQLSEGPGKAMDRMITGEVPAAVLTLVSAEAAERFPEIAGFKIFRIPLSPRSLKARRDKS